MKITNKTILALLLAAATLTACDGLKGEEKKADDTKVEEKAADEKDTKSEDNKETSEDKADANKKGENSEEKAKDEDKKDEAITSEGSSPREKLEDAIFKNRVQARAAEILLETAPETITDIKPELEALVEKSNELIEKAQEMLAEME